MDVMVVNPDGSTGRAELTLALDIATRTALAAILRPAATKAVDAAVLLARALTPLPMQPGWAAALAFSRSILPQGIIDGDDAVKAGIAAKPVIVPENITIDRGKVFVGNTFISACERLQVSIVKASPRTPTDKPHIERAFAAINSGFTQYLAGYVGQNVAYRGTNPAAQAEWTLAELQNLLDLWLVGVWQNRPHSGLRHPAIPQKTLTPNEDLIRTFFIWAKKSKLNVAVQIGFRQAKRPPQLPKINDWPGSKNCSPATPKVCPAASPACCCCSTRSR